MYPTYPTFTNMNLYTNVPHLPHFRKCLFVPHLPQSLTHPNHPNHFGICTPNPECVWDMADMLLLLKIVIDYRKKSCLSICSI